MSQFEYVSVAVSLVYALAFSRLLGSALAAFRSPARYSVHAAWLVAMFLVAAFAWWRFWIVREVDWSGPLFVYALVTPAVVSLLVSALIGDDVEKLGSYRDVFLRNRVRFFALFGFLGRMESDPFNCRVNSAMAASATSPFSGLPCHPSWSSIADTPLPLSVFARITVG